MEGTGAYGSGVRTTQREALGFAAIRNLLPRSTHLAAHNRPADSDRLPPRVRMTLSEGAAGVCSFPRPTPTGAGGQKWRSIGRRGPLARQTSFSILKICFPKNPSNFFLQNHRTGKHAQRPVDQVAHFRSCLGVDAVHRLDCHHRANWRRLANSSVRFFPCPGVSVPTLPAEAGRLEERPIGPLIPPRIRAPKLR